MTLDERFMQRAFDLAVLGMGRVAPNPLVGCVIVWENQIIGEGWHQAYGHPHAEVNAVHSVADPAKLSESTLYVNLEPCAHYGKTPPCALLLIEKKVKRVVVSNTDPNPLVAGKGITLLKNAGIEVTTQVLEEQGWQLNRRFFTFMEQKRPYLILKWAQTQDGFLARKDFSSKWISNEHARTLVHKWRSEEPGIMIGKYTALHDNPQLKVRDWTGTSPVRIVIDRELLLPEQLHVFDGSQPTLCYNLHKNSSALNLDYICLPASNFLEELLQDLFRRGMQSVMIEGGSQLLNSFIIKGVWDEARVFTANSYFKEGIAAPQLLNSKIQETIILQDNTLRFYEKAF